MILRRLIIRVITMAVAVGIVVIVHHRQENEVRQKQKDQMEQGGKQVLDIEMKSTPFPSFSSPPPSSPRLLPAATPAAP
jgi:hypothetical protein